MIYKFCDKKSSGKITISQINFIARLLENFRDKKFIHSLETIFGVLI